MTSLDFVVALSLMPVSMALAGPVADAIGLRNTFLIAGVVPVLGALVAVFAARLPADDLAHPLRDPDEPAGEVDVVASASGGEPAVVVPSEERD